MLGTDKRTAEQIRTEIIHQRDLEVAGLGGVAGMAMPLEEVKNLHLTDLATRSSAHHVRNVTCILDRALAAIPAQRVRDLRPYDLLKYRAGLLADGAGHRTANHHVARIQGMLRWARRAGLIAENPVAAVDALPETEAHQRRRRRALTESEIARLLTALERDDARCDVDAREPVRVPQAPLFRFLLVSGARYGEARQITWSDFDAFQLLVVIRPETAKTGRRRVLPLLPDLSEELLRLRAVHEELLGREPEAHDPIFRTPEGAAWCRPSNNVNRILQRVLEAAGIPRVDSEGRRLDLHALRHTCASRMARAGAGLVQAQRLLGHSDPKTTARIYTHLDSEDLRAAVQPLPGPRVERLKGAV
ncbi:MAG: tyrosine-type recombinase/integrase [Planctomycetota bacterium]